MFPDPSTVTARAYEFPRMPKPELKGPPSPAAPVSLAESVPVSTLASGTPPVPPVPALLSGCDVPPLPPLPPEPELAPDPELPPLPDEPPVPAAPFGLRLSSDPPHATATSPAQRSAEPNATHRDLAMRIQGQ